MEDSNDEVREMATDEMATSTKNPSKMRTISLRSKQVPDLVSGLNINKENCLAFEKLMFGMSLANGQLGQLLLALGSIHEDTTTLQQELEMVHHADVEKKKDAIFYCNGDWDWFHDCMEFVNGEGGDWSLSQAQRYQMEKLGSGPGCRAFPRIELGELDTAANVRKKFVEGNLGDNMSLGIATDYVSLESIAVTAISGRVKGRVEKLGRRGVGMGNMKIVQETLKGWEAACDAEIAAAPLEGTFEENEWGDY